MTHREWHITQLTPEAALEHEKRIRNLGPEIGLGWTPYNYLVTRGAISQWACHTEDELNRWLRTKHFNSPQWTSWSNGIRSAWLQPKEKED
jgi:hypothetical protein